MGEGGEEGRRKLPLRGEHREESFLCMWHLDKNQAHQRKHARDDENTFPHDTVEPRGQLALTSCLLLDFSMREILYHLSHQRLNGSRLRKEETGLSAATLFASSVCWAHHEKCQAGWVTSWNQDRREKLRYMDDATLMSEREEELESLPMRVKEGRERAGLKLNIKNTKIMPSGPIRWWLRH